MSPTHLYQDERALPGNLHKRKLSSSPPLNVASHFLYEALITLHFYSKLNAKQDKPIFPRSFLIKQ
jgi:hypothetical protein